MSMTHELREWSVDVRFNVSGVTSEFTSTGMRFMPDRAVVLFIDGALWNVTVGGPGLKVDGKPASKRGKYVYGTHGCPIEQAPDWVNQLVKEAEQFHAPKGAR